MKGGIIIEEITKEELFEKMENLISKAVENRISSLHEKNNDTPFQEEIFTRQEAAAFLKMDVRTLDKRMRENKVKYSKDGTARFKKSELIKYLDTYEQ